MKILKNIPIVRKLYENFHEESLFVDFSCFNQNIHINILNDYNLLENLVSKNILDKDDIIKNGLAKITSKYEKHLGSFSVFSNLPAYYHIIVCDLCKKRYMIVYGCGESQPGRDVVYISGIWEVE